MANAITPENISGFVVGEGCFYVEFGKDGMYKNKIRVRPSFVIEIAEDDIEVLQQIKDLIGCGTIYQVDFGRYQKYQEKKWKKHARYKVSNITDISTKLVPFFDRSPLFGKKQRAFDIFKQVVQRVLQKDHLKADGLKEISALVDQLRIVNKRGI